MTAKSRTVNAWRTQMREIVKASAEIDLVIVHHADGSNDFFSHKPEVEQCERHRVIEVCKGIILTLEAMPRRRSVAGVSQRCGDGLPGKHDTACPSGGGSR